VDDGDRVLSEEAFGPPRYILPDTDCCLYDVVEEAEEDDGDRVLYEAFGSPTYIPVSPVVDDCMDISSGIGRPNVDEGCCGDGCGGWGWGCIPLSVPNSNNEDCRYAFECMFSVVRRSIFVPEYMTKISEPSDSSLATTSCKCQWAPGLWLGLG